MVEDLSARLDQLAAAQARQNKTLDMLESRIGILNKDARLSLEGVSRIKLQMQNANARAQKQITLLEQLNASLGRLESALCGESSLAAADSRADRNTQDRVDEK